MCGGEGEGWGDGGRGGLEEFKKKQIIHCTEKKNGFFWGDWQEKCLSLNVCEMIYYNGKNVNK